LTACASKLWGKCGYNIISNITIALQVFGVFVFSFKHIFESTSRLRGIIYKNVVNKLYLSIYCCDIETESDLSTVVDSFNSHFNFTRKSDYLFFGVKKPNFNHVIKLINKRQHRMFQFLGYDSAFFKIFEDSKFSKKFILCNNYHPVVVAKNARALYDNLLVINSDENLHKYINQIELKKFLVNLEMILFCANVLHVVPTAKEYFVLATTEHKPMTVGSWLLNKNQQKTKNI
jgi:hypothetical protein